jgi:hypothetical protein
MRTQFDDAIGPVPPHAVDLERVIARGRRRERLRRWGSGGVGVAAVGLVGAVLLATSGGPGRGEDAAAPPKPTVAPSPSTGASTASPAPSPAATRKTPPAEANATELRLSQALAAAVTRVAPGSTARKSYEGKEAFRFGYYYHEDDSTGGDFNHYNAFADVSAGGRSGEMVVSLGQVSAVWRVPTDCGGGGEPGCTASVGPHGEQIMGQRIVSESATTNYVAVTRADGTAILITAANQGGQLDTGTARQTEPVLTIDQLIAIATDPALHI